jgi:hypothetical protein
MSRKRNPSQQTTTPRTMNYIAVTGRVCTRRTRASTGASNHNLKLYALNPNPKPYPQTLNPQPKP